MVSDARAQARFERVEVARDDPDVVLIAAILRNRKAPYEALQAGLVAILSEAARARIPRGVLHDFVEQVADRTDGLSGRD